jgi:signal transduction histidine kinase
LLHSLSAEDYGTVLESYVRDRSEEALYRASLLSRSLLESGLGPEDIIALHVEKLDDVLENIPTRIKGRAFGDAHQFLLEIMIAYGVHYKQYLELKLAQSMDEAQARIEREQERALEAERLGREKTEVLGIIAHELRTPLSAASMYIDIVERLVARGAMAQLPEPIGGARQALARLSRLSADLVEASRDEPPTLSFEPHDLNELIEQVCSWVLPTAGSKGITVRQERGSDPIIATVSSDAVLTIVGNLLSNAVRYTPAGGTITVRTCLEDDSALIEVSDTGIGIPEEQLIRVFEKFYRSPEARKLEPQGLGLGLALVKQLALAHGGDVTIDSQPDRGSTFTVKLPVKASAAREVA